MTSMRALNRRLGKFALRIIKAEEKGKDPDPLDLLALKETVDLIIERLSHEG